MALPASGQLSISDIATEFGDTQPNSMSEYYRGGSLVPDSAGNSAVPASGAISINNFYNAANRAALAFTIASNTQNYDLFTQVNASPAYAAGTSDITLTVNSGVSVGGTSTYALAIPSAFTAGDTISFVNNGTVVGRGGNGGAGGPYNGNAGGGGAALHALNVNFATTITNNGTLAGGGGGGGGGGGAFTSTATPKNPGAVYRAGGGGGGGGAGYTAGSGGGGGAPAGGTGGAGSATAGGGGGASQHIGNANSGDGGAGGARGAGGSSGQSGSTRSGGGGGGGGKYLVGNPYVTFAATGTRLGGVS